jgi:hypothetical protein
VRTHADTVVQQARGFPDASLRRGLQLQQTAVRSLLRGYNSERPGDAAEYDGQLVIELMGGCGSDGAGPIGVGEMFHNRILAHRSIDSAFQNSYQIETERRTAMKIVVNRF